MRSLICRNRPFRESSIGNRFRESGPARRIGEINPARAAPLKVPKRELTRQNFRYDKRLMMDRAVPIGSDGESG